MRVKNHKRAASSQRKLLLLRGALLIHVCGLPALIYVYIDTHIIYIYIILYMCIVNPCLTASYTDPIYLYKLLEDKYHERERLDAGSGKHFKGVYFVQVHQLIKTVKLLT